LWRHPNVTSQQRKTIVQLLIKAIHVTPGREVWTLEIEWSGGARSQHEALTREGISTLLKREHLSARAVPKIREAEARRGAGMGVRFQTKKADGNKAVQRSARRAHHTHKFSDGAQAGIARPPLSEDPRGAPITRTLPADQQEPGWSPSAGSSAAQRTSCRSCGLLLDRCQRICRVPSAMGQMHQPMPRPHRLPADTNPCWKTPGRAS
jgi:hypothetical protein